jgi:hypothetical protein
VLRPISNASLDDGPGAMAAPSGMANEVDPKKLAP